MNKGWTIHFSKYKPSPTIFRKIQSIDIFLSVPGLHHTRWVWSNLYQHCTGKLAGIFTMGPQYQPGHKAKQIPCVPFPTSFWASFPPRCGMEGYPIPLIISDPPFPGCHSLEPTQFVGSSIGVNTLRSMFLFPLSVFTSRYFPYYEPLMSLILHWFSGEIGWFHSTCWGWAALCEQVTQSQRKISFDYLSRERNPIECVHYFPTEEEAAIVGFEAVVDGRLIQSQVDESWDWVTVIGLNNIGCPKKKF